MVYGGYVLEGIIARKFQKQLMKMQKWIKNYCPLLEENKEKLSASRGLIHFLSTLASS